MAKPWSTRSGAKLVRASFTFVRNALGSPSVHAIEEPPARAEAGYWALTLEKTRVPMSADHEALIRMAKQLIPMRIAMLHALEGVRRELEKRLDDSEARIVRTRQLLADSSALLQQSKIPRPRVSPPCDNIRA
jgi:hypothetical protein